MASSLRDGVLHLTVDHPVAPGSVLSITPAPTELGRLFSLEGEVLACATPPAHGWDVEVRLTTVTPGDLETLQRVLS